MTTAQAQALEAAGSPRAGRAGFALAETLDRTFVKAEQSGLKLAIRGRLVALALIALWFVLSRGMDPSKSAAYAGLIAAFALLGVVHYCIIVWDKDHPLVKYLFITLDVVLLSALVATQPLFPSADLPQSMAFRNSVFPFYFVVLAVAAFSFSPRVVLWAGFAGAASWLGAFAWATQGMADRLEWSDMPLSPTREQFEAIFLNLNFVGTGSRMQESVAYLAVALLTALAVARARSIVRQQIIAERERAELDQVFGQYVPPAITAALVADRGVLTPAERTATVLFVDLADFTALTREVGAVGTVGVLNAFFDVVAGVIGHHRGVITQFQGDAVLATYNVPVEDPQHAERAVRTALEILDTVHSRDFEGLQLRVRIGVATGPVVAGSVGGGGRQSYTVHGDTVNLAARLEALNKSHGSELLIAASTAELVRDQFALEDQGKVDIRGLAPIGVYTVGERPAGD